VKSGALIVLCACLLGAAEPPVPAWRCRVVHVYPHDPAAFTQGLVYEDGYLFEGTGLNGRSSIRKVELQTGKVVQERRIPDQYFGEGIAIWQNRLVELTWRSELGFVYDRYSFEPRQSFHYTGEGWGLTHDGKRLIMSDGSSTLRFLDPQSFQETARINVTDKKIPVSNLNELEYVRGEIYANVWQTDKIVRISPETGKVTGWIDAAGLLSEADRRASQPDVLNGIAYDAQRKRLFLTGKLWPKLFEVELVRVRR
jgi:glutamine cyclotransferase